ncbi:extracellular solute-binding protein [Candidatus Leptofilum sp.]|uniref:ABC transporter substrate-binding protein n=1 Tax=Candidatus Leptofilum sp. TaxID=3241576 RepID=UPI003B5AD881
MLNQKSFKLLAILLALVLVLVACGGGGDSDTAEEADSGDTAADSGDEAADEEMADDEEMAEGEEIVLNAYVNGPNDQAHTDWVIAEFEAMNPGVTVNFVTAGEVVEDRLGIYLQIFEAQSPELDIAMIDVIWPGDLAEHFLDLNDFGAADVSGAHFPAIVENNTVGGSLVGIPYFTDAGLLYYRTDLLEKYGYDAPPATWDELEEMAATIQEGERGEGNPDFDGFVWQGRAYEGLTCDALEWIDSHGGGTIVSPEGVITVNNDAAIAALDRAAGWIGTISPVGVTDYAEEEARNQWQAGNAAFMRNWPYAYSLGNLEDSPIAGNFDVAPLPAGPGSDSGSATLGGWQLAVSKYSEHPELAAELALFIASEESQKVNALETSRIPTIMALYENDEVIGTYPWFANLLPVFTSAAARPSTATAPQYSDTSALFFTAVNSVLIGEADADEALAELELELEDLLGFETGSP